MEDKAKSGGGQTGIGLGRHTFKLFKRIAPTNPFGYFGFKEPVNPAEYLITACDD